jgi:hypothetical protein
VTNFIAIYGAVLATGLAVFEIARFRRERAKLTVRSSVHVAIDGCVLRLHVVNDGGSRITIEEAGFEAQGYIEAAGVPGKRTIPLHTGLLAIEPGGAEVFRYDLATRGFPTMLHVDDPLRAYVIDSRRRRTWGGSAPLLRTVVDSGWQAPRPPDPMMTGSEWGPIEIEPVYPSWHVWRPLNVRNPIVPGERRLRRWWHGRRR